MIEQAKSTYSSLGKALEIKDQKQLKIKAKVNKSKCRSWKTTGWI